MTDARIALAAFAVPLAYVCFWCAKAWLRSLTEARTSENIPTAKIRSAAQGYVEFQGFARPLDDAQQRSPMLNAQCVWWRLEIYRPGTRSTPTVREERGGTHRFYIEDATGRCLVDPAGAEFTPSWSRSWYCAEPGPPAETSDLRSLQNTTYQCTESVLLAGARLYVRGEFRTVRLGAQPLDLMRDKLAAWQKDDKMRALLDVDRDGKLGENELEAARRAAMLDAKREAGTSLGTADAVVKPTDGRPFVITTRLGRAHVEHAGAGTFLYLVGAIASGAALAWVIGVLVL